jgi:hypothetical protein
VEEFLLVKDHLLARSGHDVVHGGEFDGVYGARFFAHAAVDASEFIDFKLGWVLLTVIPRAFRRFDMDAPGWADGRAHHACDTLDPTLLVAVQAVHTTKVAWVQTAVKHRQVLAPDLGVLHDAAGTSLSERSEEVPQGCAKPLDDLRYVDSLKPSGGRWIETEDFLFTDCHAGCSIRRGCRRCTIRVMPGTRKTVPLFDLLSRGVSSTPAPQASRHVPPVARFEPRAHDGVLHNTQPIVEQTPFHISRNAAYIGIAILIAAFVAVYVIGFKIGQSKEATRAEKELAAAFGTRPNVAEPGTFSSNRSDPPATQGPITDHQAQQPPNPVPNALAPATGPVLSPFGPIPDPREKGLNYLALATLPRADCEAAIRFLYENRVEAIAVPVDSGAPSANNPVRYTLYAFPGFAADQLRSAAAQSLEANIARLGQVWMKEHRGTSDFRRPQWTLKK